MAMLPEGKLLRTHNATYTIQAPLGSGGRGQTYLAKVSSVLNPGAGIPPAGTPVVIKIARLDAARGQLRLRRFMELVDGKLMEEKSALTRLRDVSQVAQYIDTGTEPVELAQDDTVYPRFLVQEFIDGVILEKALPEACGRPFYGMPKAQDWFELASAITAVLLDVHQRGVIHNDLWHRNIMLRANGEPVLIDFGEAVFRSARDLSLIDQPQRKDPWIAPEWNQTHMRPSRRADIFALGGVLFWMACGQEPPMPHPDVEAGKLQIEGAIRQHNPKLLSQNIAIAEIIAMCRRFDRTSRIGDAERLRRELVTFGRQLPVAAPLETAGRIITHVRSIDTEGNVFLRRIADMLLRDTERQIEDMRRGVVDIGGQHDALVSGCVDALASLKKGDEYLAVSTLKFWKPSNIGVRGRFLSMTRLCAQRGVRIRRVFLLSPSDTHDDYFAPVMEAQIQTLAALPPDCLATRFRFLSDTELTHRIDVGDHCGYWISGDQVMEIAPVYDVNDQLRSIRLIKSDESPALTRQRFDEDFLHAEPLTLDSLSLHINRLP